VLLGETCSLGREALEDNFCSESFEQFCEYVLTLGQALIQSNPPKPNMMEIQGVSAPASQLC